MNNNYCVIMGGGVGSRFWPFSRENKPKQFLDFFGTGRSLIQQTFDRFNQIIPTQNIFVATNEMYAELIKEQIPELSDSQILLEPTRRNTAPCIAYASYHIKAINPNANIVVTPADHLILQEHHFLKNIQTGLNFVCKFPTLLTMGVNPNRPETGYGYIQTVEGGTNDNIQEVKAFTEKPNQELANIFFESGDFFWNSGIFIWNVNTIIDAFVKYLPDIATRFNLGLGKYNTPEEKTFIEEQYPMCQNISIDYGIMEKADNVHMLVADFGWSDLGTWGSLHDLAEKDQQHNTSLKCKSMFIESSNNLVALPEGKLAVIQGLEDYIVVATDDILLICQKSEEQRIKHFVTDINMKYGDEFI
ncbi:mannose-1-phosphate guanylyltransferase [Bacteroidales bacterium OttesenSCG-928-M11]|nr:mannose-1-phosphate guanylyltransferase [Bacteroidales bacterium OttesenSCG-928-M11]